MKLSRRQVEITKLVTQGLRNREIAEIMGITVRTAKLYVYRTFNKMGFSSRLELALWWVKQEHDTLSLGDNSQ